LSLPIVSGSIELPASLKNEKRVRVKLAESLRKEGFEFSVEDTGIRYVDFFNEVNIATSQTKGRIGVKYSISITAKGIVVLVISVLFAFLAGVVFAIFWYMKYTKIRHSVESALDTIVPKQREVSKKRS